jgi:signal transduction histidine kinase
MSPVVQPMPPPGLAGVGPLFDTLTGATGPGWQATPYAPLAFVATAVAVVFAVVLWRSEWRPGSSALVVLALAAAWWSLTYGLELASTSYATKLLLARLSYLGIAVVPVAWVAFALAYTGRRSRLRLRTLALLSIPSLFAIALPWNSAESDLFWASTTLVTGETGQMLALTYGPAFWAWSAYGYLLVLTGTTFLLRSVPSDARLFRVQTALLTLGSLAPLVANASYLLRLVAIDVTPFGFVASALALGTGFRVYRLLDVHPAARAAARDELVERMAEAVVVLNPEGHVVDLNRNARSVLGTEDPVGEPLTSVTPELATAVEGVEDETVEFVSRDPTRHYEVRVSPLDGGRFRRMGRLVTLHDVTERRRRERRIAVLNRLLRHDLRNDVSVIQGAAKLLSEDPHNEVYAEMIAEQATEMLELFRTVREVERTLESGGPTRSEVDLVRVVDDRVEVARRSHPDATVETDLPVSARVHATDLLTSVVDNLVENAVEHNDTDAPHVRVSVEEEVEDGRRYVELRVEDDGPGIPEPDRRVLVGAEGARLEDASGLGLWLVNWLVTESGGEVHYEANEPRGSVIRLRLPGVDEEETDGDERIADVEPTLHRLRSGSSSTG